MTQDNEIFVAGASLILNEKIEYTIETIREQLHDLVEDCYIVNNIEKRVNEGTLNLNDIWYIEIVTHPRSK